MSSVPILVLLVVALIVLNGVFAMAELAVVSSGKARLRSRAADGNRGARAALLLVEHPDRFLATVQVGITLVGIFAGAFGGATLAEPLSTAIERVPALDPYSEEMALAIVVLAITYLSLIVGELVPKRIALHSPERIASLVARPMRALSIAAAPVVWFLTRSTDIVFRLLRLRDSGEARITEEEISHLLREGAAAGVFEKEEHAMVERVFRFADQDVRSVMTPRVELEYVDLDAPIEEILTTLREPSHVRLVACRGGLDRAVGVVDVRDLLSRLVRGEALDPEAAVRPVHFVPEHLPALTLLGHFKRTGERVALVLDEYGGTAGLASLDDVLEALVGYIPLSAGSGEEPDIVRRADGSFLVDGQVLASELKELLGLPELAGEEDGEFRTVAGWVVVRLGRIPEVGEHFEADGLRAEVVDMDGPRVDRVLVDTARP